MKSRDIMLTGPRFSKKLDVGGIVATLNLWLYRIGLRFIYHTILTKIIRQCHYKMIDIGAILIFSWKHIYGSNLSVVEFAKKLSQQIYGWDLISNWCIKKLYFQNSLIL